MSIIGTSTLKNVPPRHWGMSLAILGVGAIVVAGIYLASLTQHVGAVLALEHAAMITGVGILAAAVAMLATLLFS